MADTDLITAAKQELYRRQARAELNRRQGLPNRTAPNRYQIDIDGQKYEMEAPDDESAKTAALSLKSSMASTGLDAQQVLALQNARKKVSDASTGGDGPAAQALEPLLSGEDWWKDAPIVEGEWWRDAPIVNGNTPPKSHPSFEESQRLIDKQQQEGVNGAVGAALSGTLDGIPVVGPILKGGTERAAAGIGTLINGDTYSSNLERAQNMTADAAEAHPAIHTAGEVAGAVGGTIPMVMAAPGMFGAGGGSLAARGLASTATGAGLGATDAAVRSGGDTDAAVSGAVWGGGTGLIGPVAGQLIGKGVKSLIDVGRARFAARGAGIDPKAFTFLRRAVRADDIDPATLESRLAEMGPDAMLADLGPNLQKQAGALAGAPGRGQEIVRNALLGRSAGANARIGAAVDESFGPAVVPSEVTAGIRANQEALGQEYANVFSNARAVDTAPVAEALEAQAVNLRGPAQRAVQRAREMLNITGTDTLDPNPQTLFQTRQALDGMRAAETDPNALRALTMARQSVDEVLANSVPGLKEVDARFAELARQSEALQRGQTVLDGKRTSPRPSELVDEVERGVQPQGEMVGPSAVPLRLSQGARAELDRILGNNANDIAALNREIKSSGDWNRDRLATLFGQERADRLFRVLENETAFANTAKTVTGNSETFARQAAERELGGGTDGFGLKESWKAGGTMGAVRSIALDKADDLLRAIIPNRGEATRDGLANVLVGRPNAAIIKALIAGSRESQADRLISPVVRALLAAEGTSGAR
ncbi:hypothetical protein [Rhizobium sp. Rhizsp82]|uniref:hypothetical protein n=1 Tax=Rhizobium sp. Rhizsp82 TaxID=3243057 RepID=UPI0039B6ACB0